MTQSGATLPSIRLKPRGGKRLLRGHPWIYSNEIEMDREVKALPAGGLVELVGDGEHVLGSHSGRQR